MRKISRSTPYGDLADGGAAAVVSWLALDAVFPSEIIAPRPTEKLPGPRSWRRSSRRVADAFYTAERIRVKGTRVKFSGTLRDEIPRKPYHLCFRIIRKVIKLRLFDSFDSFENKFIRAQIMSGQQIVNQQSVNVDNWP